MEAPDYTSWQTHTWAFPTGVGPTQIGITFTVPPQYGPLLTAIKATLDEAMKLPGFNFVKVVTALFQLIAAFSSGDGAAIFAAIQALIAAITGN